VAKAFGDAPALIETKPACSESSQSHMKIVRKTNERESSGAFGNQARLGRNSSASNVLDGYRGSAKGGGLDDPRLFYFRALLDGDRFFSGGGRFQLKRATESER